MAVDEKLNKAKTMRAGTQAISADDYPKPAPDPNYEEKKPPGSVARGLSKALMQSAFSKFGQAFTDTGDVKKDAATRNERLAPYVEAGGGAAAALEGRWHQMEMDNFQNEFLEPYMAQKKEMLDDFQRRNAQASEGIFEGPDGLPMPVDIKTKEGRLQAVRMTNALVSRFFALNTDMDLELQNEVGKYSSNPMIVDRGVAIMQASSAVLTQTTNPAAALETADKMSILRSREDQAEAAMLQAKNVGAAAKKEKRPRSVAEAYKHPEIGAAGLTGWLISDPEGLAILHAKGGGGSEVASERDLAMSELMRDNPELQPDSEEMEQKLARLEPQWVTAAALKYIKRINPAMYEDVKRASPHFFADEADKERGIISDKRQDPAVIQRNVDSWGRAAESHFNEYMANPNNSPDIEAAMTELNEWLQAAIYGDTDEPLLSAITAARGEGTKRYVADVLKQVPEHIRAWWHSKDGSGIGKAENPEQAAIESRAASRTGGRHARRAAAIRKRELDKKKGILP